MECRGNVDHEKFVAGQNEEFDETSTKLSGICIAIPQVSLQE